MTPSDIRRWHEEGRAYKFYKTHEWRALRAAVLREHHSECAWCRERGIVRRAETVHHVKHVDEFPELALSRVYRDETGEHDNLVPLCHECHDRAHGRMQFAPRREQLNEERW